MPERVEKNRYPTPLDEGAVRRHWSNEGYSFHTMTDRPGQAWRGFVHATNEYVTIAEGRLAVTIDGETVEAGPGDLVYIPADAVHDVVNIHSGPTRWIFGYD